MYFTNVYMHTCAVHHQNNPIFNLPFLLHLYSSLSTEYEEDYEDVIVNQMLVSKSQDTDTTEILNNLLKEYDKKLRPDIGGNCFSWFINCCSRSCELKTVKNVKMTEQNLQDEKIRYLYLYFIRRGKS